MRSASLVRSQWLEAAHAALVAIGTWIVVTDLLRHDVELAAFLLCTVALMAQVLTPRWPALGVVAFLAVNGALPRYSSQTVVVVQTGILSWLSLLAVSGWGIWLLRQRRQPALTEVSIIVMTLFLAWGLLSFATSPFRGGGLDLGGRHHPVQYLQGVALMVVAADLLRSVRVAQLVAVVICALPLLRGFAQADTGLYLETDVPAMAAMALPIALVATISGYTSPRVRLAAGGTTIGLVYLVVLAQNRGALVGVALVVLALWATARVRARWLMWALPVALAAALITPRAYFDRFRVIWDPRAQHATSALDRATVDERKQLWQAGFQMAQARTLVGVGPGLAPAALAQYLPAKAGNVLHNSALGVAAEFGLVGLAMWVGVFGLAIGRLYSIARRLAEGWLRDSARMVLGAIAAYLGVGMFISRQDEPVAYLLLGWAVAIALSVAAESPPAPTRATRQAGRAPGPRAR